VKIHRGTTHLAPYLNSATYFALLLKASSTPNIGSRYLALPAGSEVMASSAPDYESMRILARRSWCLCT